MSLRMGIYLSGPMTGIADHNVPAFNRAAALLRARGHHVINPAEMAGGDLSLPWSAYIRADIGCLLRVEAVRVLPGWERSRGARLEVLVAQSIGIPVLTLDGDPIGAVVGTTVVIGVGA